MSKLKTEEQRAAALLSFADTYHIFNNFDENHKEKGVCLANIGSIMLQKGDYRKAWQYFAQAIKNMQSHMKGQVQTDEYLDAHDLKCNSYY